MRRVVVGLGCLVIVVTVATVFRIHQPRRPAAPVAAQSTVEVATNRVRLSTAPQIRWSTVPNAADPTPALVTDNRKEALPEFLRDLPAAIKKEHDEMVSRQRSSGVSSEPWTKDAARHFEDLREALPQAMRRDAQFGRVDCYRRGCVLRIEMADFGGLEDLTAVWSQTPGFREWRGIKMRSGPLALESGRVAAAFILERPEGPNTGG